MDRKSQLAITLVVLALLLVLLLVASLRREPPPHAPPPPERPPVAPADAPRPRERDEPKSVPPPRTPADPSVHLLMGNPSGATDDPADKDNYLMRKAEFALSYNDAKGTANWVSWRLRHEDTGNLSRTNPFGPDTDLPTGYKRVFPRDYTGSGFDRGHLCPNADRDATRAAAEATFVMTNIIPQSPDLNRGAWADLEGHCRTLARSGKTLYIVAGPHGKGGVGSNGRAEAIAGGKVVVPASCWKVVLAVANGVDKPEDVGPASKAFGVVMTNDQSVGRGWTRYRTSVREVEALTGYKFFDRVPAGVVDPLKNKIGD